MEKPPTERQSSYLFDLEKGEFFTFTDDLYVLIETADEASKRDDFIDLTNGKLDVIRVGWFNKQDQRWIHTSGDPCYTQFHADAMVWKLAPLPS